MKVLSLFDGIACGRLAFERAGIPVEKYYSSEIDKYAIQVAQKNFPDIIQIGDVTKVNFEDYKDVDIIIGGSHCQDLSIAKQNREGLHGERSRLFWDFVKALSVIKPKYFLLENVASMKQEDRDAITNVLRAIYPKTECIMINSALLSAQQRKRYYWTNWHNEQPEDKGILLKDVLESGTGCVVEDYAQKICGTPEKSSTLMARDYKGFGHQRTNGVAVPLSDKSHCIDATYWKGNSLEHFLEKKNRELVAMPVPEATKKGYTEIQEGECVDLTQLNSKTRRGRSMKDKSNCLTAGNIEFYQYVGPVRIGNLPNLGKGQANRIYSVRGKSVCLNALGGGGGAKTGLYKIDLPDGDYTIRKLTPLECERLQTLPDGYTEGISNTQRYKAIGNGWTVDVIAHILKGIK